MPLNTSRKSPRVDNSKLKIIATCDTSVAGPVRILHIINDLSIGGAEMMLYRLLFHEREAELEPAVISLMDRGSLRQRIRDLGIPVFSPDMSQGLPGPLSVLRFGNLVRRIKPDLI